MVLDYTNRRQDREAAAPAVDPVCGMTLEARTVLADQEEDGLRDPAQPDHRGCRDELQLCIGSHPFAAITASGGLSRGSESTGASFVRTRGERTMRMMTAMALGFLLALGAAGSLAEEGGNDLQSEAHQGMGGSRSGMSHKMGKRAAEIDCSGMQHGMGMHDVHERMGALHEHSKMMEEITDQKKLAEEMKKHMRMMDEMIEQMMQSDMAIAPTETPSETP
jgi:hypothetical protein